MRGPGRRARRRGQADLRRRALANGRSSSRRCAHGFVPKPVLAGCCRGFRSHSAPGLPFISAPISRGSRGASSCTRGQRPQAQKNGRRTPVRTGRWRVLVRRALPWRRGKRRGSRMACWRGRCFRYSFRASSKPAISASAQIVLSCGSPRWKARAARSNWNACGCRCGKAPRPRSAALLS